jgi:Protein of unknown function (DUF3987)
MRYIAEILGEFSPERIERVIKPAFDLSYENQITEITHSLSDEENDFINENGEFSAELRLLDNEESRASPAFYGLTGEVVKAIDPHSEADPIATLITFLTAYGNIIGDAAHFVAGGRKHPARIFAVVVGATGKGRKGTSLAPVRLLFKAINPEWEKDHILSGLSSGEGLIYAVRDEETKKVPITEGKGSEKEIVGYDIEIVSEGISDKRMLVIEEEFGKTLRSAKREGNTLSPIIRELWDSGSPRTLTRSPIKATNAHISILGQITEDELKKDMSNVDLVNGLANRFLWFMVKRSKFLPSGGAFHEIDVSPLVYKINEAVHFGTAAGELKRDEEAEKLWHEIYKPLSTGTGGIVGAVTSRAEAQTMRIASLYALLDQSHTIKVIHLKAALDLWQYSFKSARYIFGNGTVLEHPHAIKLLDELKRRKEMKVSGMTRNEVREFFSRNLSKNELDAILDDLLSNGFIKVEKERLPGSKRPIQKITLLDLID